VDNLDELGARVEQLISELQDITRRLKADIANQGKSVSFEQVKEIENAILRLSRQGLPIPKELKELKLKLLSEHERHKKRVALYQELQHSLIGLLDEKTYRHANQTRSGRINPGNPSQRKPLHNERPLGSKGNTNLEDYLIPVINLMWKGLDHAEAFRKVAQQLDVRYNTVSSQCTRALGLTTDDFVRQVNSKMITSLLERKYPDQYQTIKAELKV